MILLLACRARCIKFRPQFRATHSQKIVESDTKALALRLISAITADEKWVLSVRRHNFAIIDQARSDPLAIPALRESDSAATRWFLVVVD